ncbi:major facilitator superfamily domain-containing protein [Xylariaceae sp. FL1651]|nr:major facilitator superfamily domain-containing protein [Xylariaceae sp. FL1651]
MNEKHQQSHYKSQAGEIEDIEAAQSNKCLAEEDVTAEQKGGRSSYRSTGGLIPILRAFYPVSGLDRVNLSNARLVDMNEDPRFDVGNRYSIALLAGAVMLGMGSANDWRVTVVCRFLIGVFEAGFLPCCMYLLAGWYLINLFDNILAYALIQLDGTYGVAGWRWTFHIEDTATIGFAFIGWIFTLPFPDQVLEKAGKMASFTEQKLRTVLHKSREGSRRCRLRQADRGETSQDGVKVGALGIILKTLGYSTAVVFFLCVRPYLFSMVWTAVVAYFADKTYYRMPWVVLNAAITLARLLLTAYHHSNTRPNRTISARSMCAAIQLLFAAIGGVYASTTFKQSEYPMYTTGAWAAVSTQVLLIALVALMWWWFGSLNKEAHRNHTPIQDDLNFRHLLGLSLKEKALYIFSRHTYGEL